MTVITKDWKSIRGTLQRYERTKITDPWTVKGTPIKVVVGRNGLAWGRGEYHPHEGIQKKEGDGKAPAGTFSLGKGFGYSPLPEAKISYMQSLPTTECVDDVKSKYYNQVVDHSVKDRDWSSSEMMKRSDDLYKLGVIVNHNTKNTVPSAGSCIFLHIWRNDSTGTAGCTAMDEKNIKDLISWLDEGKKPLLIQLPVMAYKRHRKDWHLP